MIGCDNRGENFRANIKQQIKSVDKNEKARKSNVALKSSLKIAKKALFTAVKVKDVVKTLEALKYIYKNYTRHKLGHRSQNYVAR